MGNGEWGDPGRYAVEKEVEEEVKEEANAVFAGRSEEREW